jgi:AbrB family looped-hinge helix DNA binding protein
MSIQVTIAANGRMSLQADIRKRLGVVGGGALLVEVLPGGVVLRTVARETGNGDRLPCNL